MSTAQNKPEAAGQALARKEIAAFCAQIAMILRAGIPIDEGLAIMADDTKNPQGKAMLEGMFQRVEAGGSLYGAMKATGQFPKYMVDMTEIGEQTGRTEEVMNSLNEYYEREEAIASSVRSAVTYPMIMVALIAVVMVVLVVEVLPVFEQVFAQLGAELTGFARSMMNFGKVLSNYSVVFITILVAIAAVFLFMRATAGGKAVWERFKHRFFGTRKLYSQIASGRFASGMALMLASGLNVDQSLDMVGNLVDNPLIHDKVMRAKRLIEEGTGFSDALVQTELFTGVYARMVSVGYKAGAVSEVMGKLAGLYEEEVNDRIAGLISVIEPTMVAVMSILVGVVLLSVMVPLLGIMSSIGMA
jgi:Type II secretory pathway, component PulF